MLFGIQCMLPVKRDLPILCGFAAAVARNDINVLVLISVPCAMLFHYHGMPSKSHRLRLKLQIFPLCL